MTNKERLEANNAKIEEIQRTLKNKILKAQGEGDYFVKVIDYDGTILKETNLNKGETFTLPTPPRHDGLVFQGWSCSQDIVDNTIIIADNNVMVGAVYTTESGLSEFDIEITKALEADIATNGFIVTLNMDGTKDWGDGTSDDLTTHTYYAYGKYTIKCNGTTMTTSSSGGLFGQSSSIKNFYCVNVKLSGLTTVGASAFAYCNSLRSITIPNSVTSIGATAFYNCYSLTSIVIPNSISTIDSYTFGSCYSLKNIVISNGVEEILSYAFNNCYSLTSIVIPNSVRSISSDVFGGCSSAIIYDLSTHTTVPTIGSAFPGINKIAKIIVPDELYDKWIVATNWVVYANNIYKASEVL